MCRKLDRLCGLLMRVFASTASLGRRGFVFSFSDTVDQLFDLMLQNKLQKCTCNGTFLFSIIFKFYRCFLCTTAATSPTGI